jgi:uncharacterized protein
MDTPPSVEAPIHLDLSRVAQDLQIRRVQVEHVVQLLDEGNTVPFIARYRRDRTGGLPEEIIRRIRHRVGQLRHFAERKQTIVKSIEAQGKLADELKQAIETAEHPKRLEDLYLPFKPKRKSLAAEAKERGLEPAALAIWNRDPAVAALDEVLAGLVNPEKQLTSSDDVAAGLRTIHAEMIAETPDVRSVLRMILWDTAKLTCTKMEALPESRGQEFKDYFQFTEPIRVIPPHRILAINRGEKENALKIKIDFDADLVRSAAIERLPLADHPHREFLLAAVTESLERIIVPSLEREIRRDLTERAQDHAIAVFARNLRSLLLQPPLRNRRVLAIDPGFRTGCRLAVLDDHGQLLDDALIHPHHPQRKVADARVILESLIRKHQIPVVAIGNGAGCRDTEELVAYLIAEFESRRRGEPPPPLPAAFEPRAQPATSPGSSPSESPQSAEERVKAESPSDSVKQSEVMAASSPATSSAAPPPLDEPVRAEPQPESGVPTEPIAAANPAPVELPPPLPSEKPPPLPPPTVDPNLPEPPADLAYVIVNEAGASDYAVSPVGREELPQCDAALRGTMSIGRRLQDPLAELVKIDPLHVGVGLYQHDVHHRHLKDSLSEVVESCVNHVGVDVNTASVPMLRYVAGLNQYVARDIVDHRTKHGPFQSREQLKAVPSVGEPRFVQAAGFLKVPGGEEPLDGTWIHPESYPQARQVLSELGFEPTVIREVAPHHPIHEKMRGLAIEPLAQKLSMSPGTTVDLLDALAAPGRDPREDMPPPIFKKAVLKIEDMQPGMELKGTVLNVVDFGAFVDVGLKDSGLVHISQMANRYIKNPHEIVAVGDVVAVWVMAVDSERKRVSLTMIQPGSERRAPERRPAGGERPPREPGPRPPRDGAPRGRGRRPAPSERRATDAGVERGAEAPLPPRPPRQLPPRRQPKPKPLPTLTQAKKEGKAYLNTLGELEAFFKARENPPAEQQSTPTEPHVSPQQPHVHGDAMLPAETATPAPPDSPTDAPP